MAFGINRTELRQWKQAVDRGEIAFLTHYWLDDRFPDCHTVTKVGARDLAQLSEWGKRYGLRPEWIDVRNDGYSHYDLLGDRQIDILLEEGLVDHIARFNLTKRSR